MYLGEVCIIELTAKYKAGFSIRKPLSSIGPSISRTVPMAGGCKRSPSLITPVK